MRHFLILLFITGCATRQAEVFRLPTGELITCQRYAQDECGLNIMECTDSESVDFECLRDTHYVGRLGVKPDMPGGHAPETRESVPQPEVKPKVVEDDTALAPVPAKAKPKKKGKKK